jgi:hypothetical protein
MSNVLSVSDKSRQDQPPQSGSQLVKRTMGELCLFVYAWITDGVECCFTAEKRP